MLWDGILIACGHYAMAVPIVGMTWVGLDLISAGTGLLKPGVATMVGKLCLFDDHRRDAGFALHYMTVNVGAFACPLITGRLGDRRGWHRGFSAAALGVTFGLAQYVVGRRHLAGRKHDAEFAPAPASALGAFEVALAPVVAAPWGRMGRRQPPASNKIATGVVLSGPSSLLTALPTAGYSSDDPVRRPGSLHSAQRPDGDPAHAHPYVLPPQDDS